jgi:putative 2-oxoglutarate-Fe(II)-dependent oxygenase superfamily protein
VVELTGENTDRVVVGVQKGHIADLPAYLQHSVDANQSEQERVSVSFNIKFSGFTEQLSGFTHVLSAQDFAQRGPLKIVLARGKLGTTVKAYIERYAGWRGSR